MFIVMVPLLFVMWQDWGATQVDERLRSPDGRQEARVQFENCGGAWCTSGEGVYVKNAWLPIDGLGLSCAAMTFEALDDGWPKIKWLDDKTLLIQHNVPAWQRADVRDFCGSVRIILNPKRMRH